MRVLSHRRRDGGYVTVLVLTVAGLLAALVSATLHVSRPSFGQAVINADELQVNGLLEAGVAAVGYALFAGKTTIKDVDGQILPFETGAIRLSVKSEAGRIDLNGAHPKLLAGVYMLAGGGAMPPQTFAARILDWRDTDDKARPGGGAERDEYQGLGLAYGPRNAPFQSVSDLRFLPGMTEEEADAMEPYLTVFNPDGLIDPASADTPVLMAIPGMTPGQATAIVEMARNPEASPQEFRQQIRPFRTFLTPEAPEVYRVRVEARLTNGFAKSAEAVIMAGDREVPYRTLSWRDIPGALALPEQTPVTGAS
ncbi:type II secretion system protein GspK [Microbaculum marinum]|uniref:Type II secretion system protein GspK n=1 Tax=Microbaculum marinum TaxID=1764581 RepID=A0AAW9RRG9_9HYPH